MATATVTLSKTEQAARLRSEAAALEKELSKLRADLESARQKLGAAEAQRQKLVEATARGELVKPAAVAAVKAEIDGATIGVEAFAPTVASKAARLDAIREELFVIDRDIAREEGDAARQARFEELTKQGHAAADTVAADIRRLLEVSFPALDSVRDALIREFIGGQFSTATGPEPHAARRVLGELIAKLSTGDQQTVAERDLLRGNDQKRPWTVRNDYSFFLRNLAPPKKP